MAQLAAAGSWFSGLEAAVFRPVSLRFPYQHQDGVDGADAMRPADLVLIRMYESKTPFNLGCDGSLLLSVPGKTAKHCGVLQGTVSTSSAPSRLSGALRSVQLSGSDLMFSAFYSLAASTRSTVNTD